MYKNNQNNPKCIIRYSVSGKTQTSVEKNSRAPKRPQKLFAATLKGFANFRLVTF